ncbi:hypothetical protein ABZY03_25245 [Streptomyces klenkii]
MTAGSVRAGRCGPGGHLLAAGGGEQGDVAYVLIRRERLSHTGAP